MLLKNKNKYQEIANSKSKNNAIKKQENKLFLDEGALIHGVEFDNDVLTSISDNGLVAPDFIENAKTSNENSRKVVMFYRVPREQTMAQYSDFCNKRFSWQEYLDQKDTENFSISCRYRVEREFLPNERTNKNNIAFIINPCKEIQELNEYDAFKEENEQLLDRGARSKFIKAPERIATIMYGIPPNLISGIWISDFMSKDTEKVSQLIQLFPDKYITTSEGELIYEPQIEKNSQLQDDTIRDNVLSDKNTLGISNLQRNINQGNTGEMHRYVAADGSRYLVKPAYKKYSKEAEPFRAYIQRAAYEVQKIIDPNSAVVCNIKKIKIDGQEVLGSIQEEIEGTNFDDLNGKNSDKYQEYASQFLREFVTDYLLGNYDTHSGNFIIDKNGILRGIDKEQSMKYITDENNEKIDLSYSPNGNLAVSVYNRLFQMYENGKIDLDLKQVSQYLDKIDSIPDSEYRKIFEDYVHARTNNIQEQNELLDKIVQRKHNARENIEEFLLDTAINRKAKESGITPHEYREKLKAYRDKRNLEIGNNTLNKSGYSISDNISKSMSNISSSVLSRDVQSTQSELKANYREIENPAQEIGNDIDIDEN